MEKIRDFQPVSPDQGTVLDESSTPTHPLVRGRLKTAFEIAEVMDQAGQPAIDQVVFVSVSRMDAGE